MPVTNLTCGGLIPYRRKKYSRLVKKLDGILITSTEYDYGLNSISVLRILKKHKMIRIIKPDSPVLSECIFLVELLFDCQEINQTGGWKILIFSHGLQLMLTVFYYVSAACNCVHQVKKRKKSLSVKYEKTQTKMAALLI